jgi:hypothetical protein
MKKNNFISKKHFKKRAKKCEICGEEDFDLLNCHRIKEQKEYSNNNCACLCVTCHTLVHRDRIQVFQRKNSSAGKLFHYIDESGKEHFKPSFI